MTQTMLETRPLAQAIGVEIVGLDLSRSLSLDAMAAVRQAWLMHGLLLFRGQELSETALVTFSRGFGELELPPASERSTRIGAGTDQAPEVWIISNVVENGQAIGSLGAGEAEWHTDMSYIEEPPSASILHAKEIPASGGDTSFASMAAALAAMPADLRQAISGRSARHDSSYTSAGDLRQGAAAVDDVTRTDGAVHPAVRTHPETGRQVLFLGRRRNAYLEGYSVPESEQWLDRLWQFCTQAQFCYTHRWQVGDVLAWDNRSVIHRREAFNASARRVMLRTQIRGDRPY